MAWKEPDNGLRDSWKKNKRNAGGGKPGLESTLKELLKRIGRLGGPGGLLTIVVAILLAWLLLTSYAVIGSGRVGVVQRFGAYARTLNAGFHLKLPAPIETVQPVATSRVRTMSDHIRMLTREQDIVTVDFIVQYQVTDPKSYLFNARDPDGTLNEAAQAAVRAVIGAQAMDDVLTGLSDSNAASPHLGALQQQVHTQLQRTLDAYGCGLRVNEVSFQAITPPKEVKDAFDDVIVARQDRLGLIDQAKASTSQDIPNAKGEASRLEAEAALYKAERIAQAHSNVERFNLILKEYRAAPGLTRLRLWLETMEGILHASNTVIDDSDGRSVIHIDSDRSEASRLTSLPGVGTVAQPSSTPGKDVDKRKQP